MCHTYFFISINLYLLYLTQRERERDLLCHRAVLTREVSLVIISFHLVEERQMVFVWIFVTLLILYLIYFFVMEKIERDEMIRTMNNEDWLEEARRNIGYKIKEKEDDKCNNGE